MNGTATAAARSTPGGCTPITAGEVGCGDVLAYDGREVEVTARPRPGSYWFGAERAEGVAIDWRGGSASGVMFRRGAETLYRVRKADPA